MDREIRPADLIRCFALCILMDRVSHNLCTAGKCGTSGCFARPLPSKKTPYYIYACAFLRVYARAIGPTSPRPRA